MKWTKADKLKCLKLYKRLLKWDIFDAHPDDLEPFYLDLSKNLLGATEASYEIDCALKEAAKAIRKVGVKYGVGDTAADEAICEHFYGYLHR